MVAGLLGLVLLAMILFPETPLARGLHLFLVELPLKMTEPLQRRHLILLAILLACSQSLALLGSAELILAYAVDLSIYADVVLTTTFVAAASRIRAVWWSFKTAAARVVSPVARARSRARRTKPVRSAASRPSNDDDAAWGAFARAA